jgi:hypothetical protein
MLRCMTAIAALSVTMLASEAFAAAPDNPYRTRARRAAFATPVPQRLALVSPAAVRPAAAQSVAPKVSDAAPLLAIISLADQRITIHNGQGQLAESRVSSGQEGYRTPTGLFSIIQRNRYHESNIYESAPMPYMQRLTWSGIALHEGNVPGYPASHGCIRLPGSFAQKLWGMTKLGARVVVAPSNTSPISVSHANLPIPLLMPRDTMPGAVVAMSSAATLTLASAQPQTGASLSAASGLKPLTPIDVARQLRAKAVDDAATSAKAAKIALDIAAIQSATANEVAARKQRLNATLLAARAQIAKAARMVLTAQTPAQLETANAAVAVAETRIAELERDLEVVADDEATVEPIAFAAARVAREAETANDAKQADLQDINRRLEPVQVFVSRKAQTVYVRQGLTQVFEAPVTLRDPNIAIGTHLYLATGATNDQSALTWTAVTVPEVSAPAYAVVDGDVALRAARSRRGVDPRGATAETRPMRQRDTAASALDRIEMPEDARRFIAERLWIGAALTISDHGISNETGKGTDFVVLTK